MNHFNEKSINIVDEDEDEDEDKDNEKKTIQIPSLISQLIDLNHFNEKSINIIDENLNTLSHMVVTDPKYFGALDKMIKNNTFNYLALNKENKSPYSIAHADIKDFLLFNYINHICKNEIEEFKICNKNNLKIMKNILKKIVYCLTYFVICFMLVILSGYIFMKTILDKTCEN